VYYYYFVSYFPGSDVDKLEFQQFTKTRNYYCMKKMLGYLAMICCISIAKGQDGKSGAPVHSLDRALKIMETMGMIKDPIYDKKILKRAEPVYVPLRKGDDSLVQKIFAAQPRFNYKFEANRLAFYPKTAAEIASIRPQYAKSFRGRVLNDAGMPMQGASVMLRANGTGVQ
jgi:hypothetical protein